MRMSVRTSIDVQIIQIGLAKRHVGHCANQRDYVYSNILDRPLHANRKCGHLANI